MCLEHPPWRKVENGNHNQEAYICRICHRPEGLVRCRAVIIAELVSPRYLARILSGADARSGIVNGHQLTVLVVCSVGSTSKWHAPLRSRAN